ncbi:MAG: Rieske 2Fe-2S domain-containing protein [Mycobacterium sp.]
MATYSRSSAADTPPPAWRYAGTLDDLWEGEVRGVDLGGVDVVLCNVDGELFAYEDRCPHLANPISHGVLQHNTLRCAAHEWEFDARTGQGVNPQAACLKPFPVRIDDDRIFIQIAPVSAGGVDEPDRQVGPVLHATPFAHVVAAVIEDENDDIVVLDEGAYLRVLAPGACRLPRAALEAATGPAIRFPGDLEVVMSSFTGVLKLTDDEATWTLTTEPTAADPPARDT